MCLKVCLKYWNSEKHIRLSKGHSHVCWKKYRKWASLFQTTEIKKIQNWMWPFPKGHKEPVIEKTTTTKQKTKWSNNHFFQKQKSRSYFAWKLFELGLKKVLRNLEFRFCTNLTVMVCLLVHLRTWLFWDSIMRYITLWSKHIKGSEEHYLFGQNTTCKFLD